MGPNSTRSSRSEVQVTSMVGKLRNGTTLNTFGRCFIAQAHDIFNKIPVNSGRCQAKRDEKRVDESYERWPKVSERRGQTKSHNKKGTKSQNTIIANVRCTAQNQSMS